MLYNTYPTALYKKMSTRIPKTLGFERYILSFDGVDDYVETGSDATAFASGASFEAWVRLDTNPTTGPYFRPIIGKNLNRGLLWIYGGYGFSPMIVMKSDTDGGWPPYWAYYPITPPFPLLHVIGTWDGSCNRIYINGELKNTSAVDTWTDETAPFYVMGAPSRNLGGLAALVRVYNRVLSDGEIKWNSLNYYNPVMDGLVLWLPMEEGHGTTVKDWYGNNGTIYGATWERVKMWELRQSAGL